MAYSDEFNSMKQEAIRRVREMQKRSRSVLDGHSQSADEQSRGGTGAAPPPKDDGISSLLGSLLGTGDKGDVKLFDVAGIPIDEEKALIGMLIYILYKQGADIKLLLGLGYLLL